MISREEAIHVLESWVERDKKMPYADRLENIEIYNIAIEALKERLAIDHETMRADFGEVELRGLDKIGGDEDCMDEDAKQASIPYDAPRHDWK